MRKAYFSSLFVLAAVASQAQVVFSNFGPGDAYDTAISYTISGSGAPVSPQIVASQFVSSGTGSLGYVKLSTTYFSGGTGIQVTLLDDDGSDQLGSAITWWNLGNPGDVDGTVFTLNNAFPSITLNSGQKYWLKVESTAVDQWAGWSLNSIGDVGRIAGSFDNGGSFSYFDNAVRPVFEVATAAVPEPASLAFLGLATVGILRRRQRS